MFKISGKGTFSTKLDIGLGDDLSKKLKQYGFSVKEDYPNIMDIRHFNPEKAAEPLMILHFNVSSGNDEIIY